ncbi:hypothetical protein PSPO01_16069 [Paraphaeosphaeria sporulosa]
MATYPPHAGASTPCAYDYHPLGDYEVLCGDLPTSCPTYPGCTTAFKEDAIAPRPVSCSETSVQQPMLHADSQPLRPYENTSGLPLSSPAQHYYDQVIAVSGSPNDPLLHYDHPDMYAPPPQAAVTWTSELRLDLSSLIPQHALGHADHASLPSVTLASERSSPETSWAMVNTGTSVPILPVYDTQMSDVATFVKPASQYYAPTHHIVPGLAPQAGTLIRGRQLQGKKDVAKVPKAFVPRRQKSKVSKRQGPLNPQCRGKAKIVRKKGACIRCRLYKRSCDDNDPCQTCQALSRSDICCSRLHLKDAILGRHCNAQFNQEECEFPDYKWVPNCALSAIDIIWNLPSAGPIYIQPMRITTGIYCLEQPISDVAQPYSVYDSSTLVSLIEEYSINLQPAVEQWIFAQIQHDQIAILTYQEVFRLRSSSPNDLLHLCMRIQCLSILSQGHGTTSSVEPLPRAIGEQIEVALLKLLQKLEKTWRKLVDQKIFKTKIKPWYELFLALYVVLWNLEYIHCGAETYIESVNASGIENYIVSRQMEKWEHSFNIFLKHWQAVLRNFAPFQLARENPEELRLKGHLDKKGFDTFTIYIFLQKEMAT